MVPVSPLARTAEGDRVNTAQVEAAIRKATIIRPRVVSPAGTVKLQESLRRLGADEGIVASVAPAAPRTPSNLAPRSGEDGRVEPKER